MAGSDTEQAVYYEDLPLAKTKKQTVDGPAVKADTASKPSVAVATDANVNAGNKRQRTLMDMFGPSTTVAKKPRLGQAASFGSQALNSIPFSLADYVNSLSEEEKDLLRLECDTMGKIW